MRLKLNKFIILSLILSMVLSMNVSAADFFDNDYEYHGDVDTIEAITEPLFATADSINEFNDITQIFITTENNETPTRDSYINASISIKADDKTAMNKGIEYTTAKIKVRGNSTSGLDKKPYNIKFGSKVEILGFTRGKKYCLLANRYDKSFLRNYLAFTLSSESNNLEYTPQFRFADVHLNGTYIGNYLVTTPIETGSTRLDIDTDGNDSLLELNTGRTEPGISYVTSPLMNVRLEINEPEEPTQDQINNINSVLLNAETVMQDASTLSVNEIANYVDIDSFIDFYLIEEYFKNRDVQCFSTRFYIKNNVLYASPSWDFDLSSGNFPEANLATYTDIYALTFPWIRSLLTNDDIKARFVDRFNEMQLYIQKLPYYDLESIDYLYRESFKRDKDVAGWDYKAQGLDREPEKTHKLNVAFLKDWLINRNRWLIDYFNISPLNYANYYDTYYKAEILSRKYDDIKNDTDIQNALLADISNSDQDQVNYYTNVLNSALLRYPNEVYEDMNDNAVEPEPVITTKTIDVDDTYSVTCDIDKIYNGSNNRKASDYNIIVTNKANGITYKDKDVKIKVKNGKNTGTALITIRSVKGIKNSKKIFKNTKISVNIVPLQINSVVKDVKEYTADGNLILDIKNSKVKKIYALVSNGKKVKKLKVKTYKVDGNKITFSKNYKGILTINTTIE